MASKSPSQQPDVIFVGGPSLQRTPTADKSQSLRSALMRRVYTDKLSRVRSEQALKLDQMLQAHRAASTTSSIGEQGVEHAMVIRERDTTRGNTRPLLPNDRVICVSDECRCTLCDPRAPAANAVTIPSPQSSVSAGRLDPFVPDTVTLGPAYDELAGHVFKVIWPAFRDASHAQSCYRSWMTESDREILTCATLFAASVHRDHLWITYGPQNTGFESEEQLQYRGMTLRLVRERLSDLLPSGVSDSLIMCILYLAAHHDPKGKAPANRDPSPFTPPFTDLQSLDVYGSNPPHQSHWRMVHQLVQLRGGIQTLKLYRLGWLLSLTDLMNAVGTLTKPTYPLVDLHGRPFVHSSPLIMLRIPELARHLTYNKGFYQLRLLNPPVKSCIVSRFLDLCQLSQALHSIHTSDSSMVNNLGDCRNLVHHRLLSLPTQNDSAESILDYEDSSTRQINRSRDVYLMCRYGALLYAIQVTFPLPRTLQIRQILLSDLKTSLAHVIGSVGESTLLELLLWPAMVGAISAEGNHRRRWFVSKVHWLAEELAIKDWTHLLGILQSFAWVDAAGNEGAYQVWSEAILCSSCDNSDDDNQ